MVDNPFAVPNPFGTPPPAEPDTNNTTTTSVEETKEVLLPVEEEAFVRETETPLEVVQRVLSEYNNLESDIPLSHRDYWEAKGRL